MFDSGDGLGQAKQGAFWSWILGSQTEHGTGLWKGMLIEVNSGWKRIGIGESN